MFYDYILSGANSCKVKTKGPLFLLSEHVEGKLGQTC